MRHPRNDRRCGGRTALAVAGSTSAQGLVIEGPLCGPHRFMKSRRRLTAATGPRLGGTLRLFVLLGLARESQPPQLLGSVANTLLRRVIFRSRLWSIGFLVFPRLEQPLGAVTIDVFMLGHAD